MTNLPVQTSEIELPFGVIRYLRKSYPEEPAFPESKRLLQEPPVGYARRKAAAAEELAKETKPYPFRKDLLWKTIIEDVPGEFLRFFFPAIAGGRDPGQKIEFLNKELLQLFPPEDDKFAPRRVDALLKIPMQDGRAVILHCEVQGDRQGHFSERMYRYFGRLWDTYPRQVKALAILTDRDRGFHPEPYREGGEAEDDHRLCYHYKTFKVLDQSEEELEQSDNPFALVILATKAALKRENGDYTEEAYFKRKLELVHWLKGRSRSETQTRALLSFLKYYRPLEDPALKHKFDEQLKERNKTMGTVEYLVNEAKEKGRCEGREEGREEGRKKAREEEKSSFVRSLLRNTDFDDEKIATLAAVEKDAVTKQRQALTGMDLSGI